MIPLLILNAALAAAVERFPWQATVDLGSCLACDAQAAAAGGGAWRVDLPATLRTAADPPDASDLALVDAAGRDVPFAWVRGRDEPECVSLWVRATERPDTWLIDELDRPVDGLRVRLWSAPAASTVQVYEQREGRWQRLGEPQLVWELDDTRVDTVALPPTRGPLLVEVVHHHRLQRRKVDIDGLRWAGGTAPPEQLDLPVVDQRLEESGWMRYTVDLPHPLPATRMHLQVEQGLFERGVVVLREQDLQGYGERYAEASIRRTRVGDAEVDQVTVELPGGLPQDRLVFAVDARGGESLVIPRVTVELEGLDLLLLDPGAGPFTLLAGAPPGTTHQADLQVAVPELDRLASARVAAETPRDNPAYRPPELRANLADPGPEVPLDGFRWRHAVLAEPGLVRVPLPAEVLAGSEGNLPGLRLVDAQGRGIPHLLRRSPVDNTWTGLSWTREEADGVSTLRVPLPEPAVPVATVTLSTSAPLFSRQVTLSRVQGNQLLPLRSFSWLGADRPLHSVLEVEGLVGGELVVRIDNGSDPPLPLDAIDVGWPAWELVAWIPEGGASLVYGDPHAGPAEHDIALLGEELARRATVEAGLGPREALLPPPRSFLDEAVLLAGVGVLVAGLGLLGAGLVRRVPEGPEADGTCP